MGSKKRRTPRRSLQFSQKKRFPVGELARERASLQQEYLSKSKELSALRKKLERLQKNSEKIRECVGQVEASEKSTNSKPGKITEDHITKGLSSIAQQLTDQSSTRVVTAVCAISRNRGKERESVGQGCLVQTKQSNECCIVTADKVIPDGQLDTCEVEFTKENSKLKRFSLMDIKKKVKYVPGLVIIVIELNSPKLKHKNNTCSIFTRSPLTITALDERKEQFCYIDRKCYILKVSNDKAIEFRDHAPSTKIPNGLVILQNSTDNSVVAVGIQSQVDGNQKMTIWMNEILAVDDNTDDRHTSPTGNEDSTDSAIRGVGGADQKFQSSKGAYKPERDQDEAVLGHKMFTIGGNEEEVLQAEDNQGFEYHRRPSPTELSFRSFQEPASTIHSSQINNHCFVANLAPVNGKEKPTMMKVQQDNLVSPLAVTDGKGFRGTCSTLNSVIPLGKLRVELPEGYDGEGRRHSYPNCSLKKEEQCEMKRCFSDMTRKEKKKIKLDDPLAETILNRLDLLEALSRRLDKEYKYGGIQCWKHIAQHFGITEETYQSFKCSKIHSPTEAMLAYLQSFDPNITTGELKDKLRTVKRQDVVDVLVECEKITDGTMVCSLFESNPDIIGRIAFLLDKEKVGLENWVQLAEKLDIPKNVSKSFETCNTNNPTDGLFEYLKTHYLKMTVEELITHLKDMKRFDVVKAIEKSTQVKSGSLIKDLMEDLLVMDNVCELLNQKLSSKVQGWRHLGARLKIKKDILDDLSPPEEDYECPTEALIRHLGGWKPYLKIADFIRALHEIDRPDTIAVVECYLPDGCVSERLRS